MDQDCINNASLLASQEHPWLQRCGNAVDLCAGEAVPSPGKDDHVPSIHELSATRHAERNNSGRRNRRRHVRKQRKKSPTNPDEVHLDAIEIELDSPTRMIMKRNWSKNPSNEDSFLTDDEAEMDEDEINNNYINNEKSKFYNSNVWSANLLTHEAGDVTSESGYEQSNVVQDWFNCRDQIQTNSNDAIRDCKSPRQDNVITCRSNTSSVLSSWMRVPCVGKQPMDFSYSIKKEYHESKKNIDCNNLKSKKKRKKSKNALHQLEAASDSQETISSFNSPDGSKNSKTMGPVKWFRKTKSCKSTSKMVTNSAIRPPVDSLQLPAPEGSILKRPIASCQSKPKKKVRWASDLLQVRYFRSEPTVPSQFHPSPRRSGNRVSSYDLDILLFPWQEGNHSSRDAYMTFIQ